MGSPTSDDVAFLPLTQLVSDFRTGRRSPVEVARMMLERIGNLDPKINAYREASPAVALRAAERSEARWAAGRPQGPLDGVPFSVKDLLMVKGFAFRRGSRATSTAPAVESAPIVDRVMASGAVLLGITTMPEFGFSPLTVSPLTGITRNPWDIRMHAGGSSGGAAASVAAGLGYFGLATDAGGSARIPASLCGVVGLKPTGGLIPTYPASPLEAVACPGVITRSVGDAALVLDASNAFDVRDVEAFPTVGTTFTQDIDAGVHGMRIAFSQDLGYASNVDPGVLALVMGAVRRFESLGATVEVCDPGFKDPADIFMTLYRAGLPYALSKLRPHERAQLGQALRDAAHEGTRIDLRAYFTARDARRTLAAQMARFHQAFDILITPTVATPAFAVELSAPAPFAASGDLLAWTPFTFPFNLTHQPAISVPCGFTQAGLPVGLQIVGPRFGERTILRAALSLEASLGLQTSRPSL
ncbi:amidase [Reyranella sp. CPCC 100927]|uniref:amidase n=1 Tax=Reyranella sp. CPCC 100927 TaxID=2599616 RepID=UPI0011B3DB17|nr:amidase [Reyranella sp. CPCC 100927]TWT12641.1 amidase [Reyranella sp. CPCC 100927]